jgi:hypothetical protein
MTPCAEAFSSPRALKTLPRLRDEIAALRLFGTNDTRAEHFKLPDGVTGFLKTPAILIVTVPPTVVPASAAEHEIRPAATIIRKSFINFPPKFGDYVSSTGAHDNDVATVDLCQLFCINL